MIKVFQWRQLADVQIETDVQMISTLSRSQPFRNIYNLCLLINIILSRLTDVPNIFLIGMYLFKGVTEDHWFPPPNILG
jgi:hypothetical protein